MSVTTIPAATYTDVYVLDPETEDLIRSDELVDGMVVLIESENCRSGSYIGIPDPAAALTAGRWCRVEKIRREPGAGVSMVSFIGVYQDGSKFTRRYGTAHSWYVKLSSFPGGAA